MILTAAFSLCPNDIFLFRSFLEHRDHQPYLDKITMADIQTLNALALQRRVSLIKISTALFPLIADHYNLMDVGNTLGYGCGPLVLSLSSQEPLTTLATPGETTTAHVLAKRYYPLATLVPMPYNHIVEAILSKKVCGGVLIHEERFSYNSSLILRADLGELWERETSSPLPLGCLVIAKNIPVATVEALTLALRTSLLNSLKEPKIAGKKALEYAQSKDLMVIHKFIHTYITEETFCLSTTGKKALKTLWRYCAPFIKHTA
ncbi:MqnA/MqnD/SBP family protein [Candidatus Chlamydia sanziniae]|nr:MqnA/MqnD/SBP family protein [Candidatus Chlamydia sanziniae]